MSKKEKNKQKKQNVSAEEEAIARKTAKLKKKTSVMKRIMIGVVVFIVILALLLGGAVLAVDIYIGDMLDLVSYEIESESEFPSSFVPSFDESDDHISFELSIELSEAPVPSEMPEYEEIEDWFDGYAISDEYEDEVLNILLVGADNAASLSDTMVLLSVNPVKQRIVLSSFMRDTYIQIPGYGYNRLNAAHAYGGSKLLIKTLETNFGIEIDHYARVNFGSFRDVVNAIGGVDLVVNDDNYNYFGTWSGISGLSKSEATNGTHTVHLNGAEALAYARNRNYATGDFMRTLHQRDFLSQFLQNCRSASLDELHSMLEAALPHVATDIPKDELKSYLMNAFTYLSYSLSDARVPCDNSWNHMSVSGASVLNVNISANAKYIKAAIYG